MFIIEKYKIDKKALVKTAQRYAEHFNSVFSVSAVAGEFQNKLGLTDVETDLLEEEIKACLGTAIQTENNT